MKSWVVLLALILTHFIILLLIQEELDLTAPNKAAMLELPEEKKWQIYCNKKKVLEVQFSIESTFFI